MSRFKLFFFLLIVALGASSRGIAQSETRKLSKPVEGTSTQVNVPCGNGMQVICKGNRGCLGAVPGVREDGVGWCACDSPRGTGFKLKKECGNPEDETPDDSGRDEVSASVICADGAELKCTGDVHVHTERYSRADVCFSSVTLDIFKKVNPSREDPNQIEKQHSGFCQCKEKTNPPWGFLSSIPKKCFEEEEDDPVDEEMSQ